MIGFTLDAEIYKDGESEQVVVILSLDTDVTPPMLDVRIAGGDVIASASVPDAYEAIDEVRLQYEQRQLEHPQEPADA